MTLRSFFSLVDLGLAAGGKIVDAVRWARNQLGTEETPTGPLPRRDEEHIRDQIERATRHTILPPRPPDPPDPPKAA